MPPAETLAVFVTSALILLLVPGPAVLYIVTRSLSQGTRAGIVSCLGLEAGTLIHISAAALGLSAVLATSTIAFSIVKYAGAAYLIWLGIQRLRSRDGARLDEPLEEKPLRRVFLDGIVVNLLNPKSTLFFFAFLPQFVVPGGAAPAAQIIFLGLIFMPLAFLTDASYAILAGKLRPLLTRRSAESVWQRLVPATVYIGLGVAAALSGRDKPLFHP